MSYEFRGIVMDEDIKESIDRYANHGVPTGGFLQACIENNLSEAVGRADDRHMAMIPAIVGYLYNEVDRRCWGRAGVFGEWVKLKHEERREEQEASAQ